MRVVAAILHLGNVDLVDLGDGESSKASGGSWQQGGIGARPVALSYAIGVPRCPSLRFLRLGRAPPCSGWMRRRSPRR